MARKRSCCYQTTSAFVPPGLLLSALLHIPGNVLNTAFQSYTITQVCEVGSVRPPVVSTGPTSTLNGGSGLARGGFDAHLNQIHETSGFNGSVLVVEKAKDSIGVRGGGVVPEDQSELEDDKTIVSKLENLGIPPGSQLEEILKTYFSTSDVKETKPLDHGK